ncbi:MAG: hypothetical protein DMD54_08095 [Gemmatimonadetes bacterium]|nr:MAG: hypothetical protein DMD54_08095 [Gemmatimonadota bacterium]
MTDDRLGVPRSIPGAPLNSTAAEQQPGLSGGGRILVFASSRSGGFGGTDIWVSTRTLGGGQPHEELAP